MKIVIYIVTMEMPNHFAISYPTRPTPSFFIPLLKDTQIEAGWWIGDYTGHRGDLLLPRQNSKEQTETWAAEIKDSPYCTFTEIPEIR